MERLLARLERHLGRFAFPHIINVIVGGMAITWVMSLSRPGNVGLLTLDMDAVRMGQYWRLVSFIFVPPMLGASPLWVLLGLYFTWWAGASLEQHWGAFRFNLYYLLGMLGAIGAAAVVGQASDVWLDASLMLAFATVFPDVRILLFFILPVKAKWLGLLSAAGVAFVAFVGDWPTRAAVAASFLNYVVFFSEHWVQWVASQRMLARQRSRLQSFRSGQPGHGSVRPTRAGEGGRREGDAESGGGGRSGGSGGGAVFGQRLCAICGAREADGADIRVCSCDKCGGTARTLCLEHARNH